MHAVSGLPSLSRRRTRHRRAPHPHQTSPGIRRDLRLRRCTSPGPAHISVVMTNSTAFLTCAFEATQKTEPAGAHDLWIPAVFATRAGTHALTCGGA